MRYDEIQMASKDFSVVDAATAANENFAGIIDKLKVGEGANLPIHVERNEIIELIDCMTQGITTGATYDPDLAADNDPVVDDITRRRHFNFKGPFQFRNMLNPVIDLSTRAITDEFASASAFTATIIVLLKVSDQKQQAKPGFYWHREVRTADTRHEVPLGPSMVTEIYMIGDTARAVANPVMTRVQLPTAAEGGVSKASTTRMDVDVDEPALLENEYAIYKTIAPGATTVGKYRIHGIRSNLYADRRLVIENSSATALTLFAKNLVA